MLNRKKIGKTENYRDREVEVRFMGPDCLAYVDGMELPNFYVDPESARIAARKYIDKALEDK